MAAILGSNILSNVAWLDPVGGLLVSIMVIRAGWGNTSKALLELADVGIDAETKTTVQNAAAKALANQSFASGKVKGSEVEVREIQGIKAGQSYSIDLELAVPGSLSVGDTRAIEDLVRQRVGASNRGIRRVKIKFVALDDKTSELADEFISLDRNAVEEIPHDHEHDHEHDHKHDHSHNHHDASDAKKKL